ncbi:MAG: hypothetical protein J5687_09165 [Treponema sp.]|nr:hypothetical protein [Treponema sp.]
MKSNSKLFEENKQEIATAIYKDLLAMSENVHFGTIGVNFTFHNGSIEKVEFTETRKTRFTGGAK